MTARYVLIFLFLVLCAPLAVTAGPDIYVSTTGSDSNDGLTWETAKLTLNAAKNIAVSPSIINVGPGTFSGSGNENIDWKYSDGIGVVGSGPLATVFQTSNTGFIRNLNSCSIRTLFSDFKVVITGDGTDGWRAPFTFWTTASEPELQYCNATFSNLWLKGEYDGDQFSGIAGTRSCFNGNGIYFGGWGTETDLEGEAVVTHCLIEGFGRAVAYDDYRGGTLSHTVQVERCTIVNCASPDQYSGHLIRLRGTGGNRNMNIKECVIAYGNSDPYSANTYAVYDNDSTSNHVTCTSNLIWHIGPNAPHENYYNPTDRIDGEETDEHYEPNFKTIGGEPYVLADSVERGWRSTDPEYFVSVTGDDGNDGLSWATAKATLEGAKAIAVSPSTINVGSGVFSANDNIEWTYHGGVNVIGVGPTETVFRVSNSFIIGLNGCEAHTTFADFKVEIVGDGNDWSRTALGLWTDSENPDQHVCNATFSNLWLKGEYDGDQLNGIPGTSSKANGSGIFFGGWGGDTSLAGEIDIVHCLIEGFGRAVAYDDYAGGALSHTVRVERCTIVNCATPGNGAELIWLRGSGGNRTMLVSDTVIAYGNDDPLSYNGFAIFNHDTFSNTVVCSNNLVWHIGPDEPHTSYYAPDDRIEGEENDAHYEPDFKTIGGEPYVLADNVERGWRTTQPEYYVSFSGNDANDGLTWATAKLTLNAVRAIAVSPSIINVGPGIFSGSGNENIDWKYSDGVSVVGAGPTATVFQTSSTGFIRNLNSCQTRTRFADFKVVITGDGTDGWRAPFTFWTTASEPELQYCNATFSNLWLKGEYDGDQFSGIAGTRSCFNGNGIYFGGWGTETDLEGEAIVTHCLIEGFGRAVAYDDYRGGTLSHTVQVERCTMVNCASPDQGSGHLIRLRGSGGNRNVKITECVIAYGNSDPCSANTYAVYDNDSTSNQVTCSSNLIWHIGPNAPHENYYQPIDRIDGEETDEHYEPTFKTIGGEPYVIADDVERGWRSTEAELPQYYVATDGDDGNDGLSWATAKLTLEAARNIAVSPSTINVGAGIFSGVGNENIYWGTYGGIGVIGAGPTATVFQTFNTGFIRDLNGCSNRTLFANFKVEVTGDGNDWSRAAFQFWSTAAEEDRHWCNATISNVWMTGEYDGDQLNGIPGTRSKRNGTAVFFGGWGTETALKGEAVVSHCLIEGFGRAVAYDGYEGSSLSHTVSVERCTIVNCASPDGAAADLIRLRASSSNRWMNVRECVIAYNNNDPYSYTGYAVYNNDSLGNHVTCSNNLIWHIGPNAPHENYYQPTDRIDGEETDEHYAPTFKTIGGEPYVLADDVERGWRTTEAELPQYYVASDGNDGNDGLSWATAKLTLEAARNIAVSPSTINVGPGTFSGAGNENIYWGTYGGIGVVGAGPTATVFQTSNTRFIRDLNGCSNRTLFANFKVEVTGDGTDWSRSAFQFWTSASEPDRQFCNATFSNIWMKGEYDGDQLNEIAGTRDQRNGTAIFFGGWGTEANIGGEVIVSHCLIEGFGRAAAYDGYEGGSLSHTVQVENCTIVNCASPDHGDADLIRLRGSGGNRTMNIEKSIIAYGNSDPYSDNAYAIYNHESMSNHVACSDNLVWYIGPNAPHENYYTPVDRIEGEENDVHFEPLFKTNNGLPYALSLAVGDGVERGWLIAPLSSNVVIEVDGEEVEVNALEVLPASAYLPAGASLQLEAWAWNTAAPASNYNVTGLVNWFSDAPAAATVSNGWIQAAHGGLAHVRAVLEGLSAAADVLVTESGGIPVNDWVDDGFAVLEATVGYEDWHNIFDDNSENYYKTILINPAVVTVTFDAPQVVVGAEGRFSHASYHDWTLEVAGSTADLEDQTNSYRKVFGPERLTDDLLHDRWWTDVPATGTVYRFTVLRAGNPADIVHIRRLALLPLLPETDIVMGVETVRVNRIVIEPDPFESIPGRTESFTAYGELTYSNEAVWNVSDYVDWSVADTHVAVSLGAGVVESLSLGSTPVRAFSGDVAGIATLTVREARAADLDVGYVQRTPAYNRFHVSYAGDPQVDPAYAGEQKWPAPGETVTYTAHCWNRGDFATSNVVWRWVFDGTVQTQGVLAVCESGVAWSNSWSAPWPADAVETIAEPGGAYSEGTQKLERGVPGHRIRFELDPFDVIVEQCELNNVVDDDIVGVVFWLFFEETPYRLFAGMPNLLESYSPEDWARMMVRAFERRLNACGCPQPVRLDRLDVWPDLSLSGASNPERWLSDGSWDFIFDGWQEEDVLRYAKSVEGGLMHEWGHQIGIVDLYRDDTVNSKLLITTGGVAVAGTPACPNLWGETLFHGNMEIMHDSGAAYYVEPERGMMANHGKRYFCSSTVAGMNRNLGMRRGFYGDYMAAVQSNITLRVRHLDGTPVDGAAIRVFQRGWDEIVPDNPKFSGTTDAFGEWDFPHQTLPGWEGGMDVHNPWSSTNNGYLFQGPDVVARNRLLVVELQFDGWVEYHFVEVDAANLAFAAGETERWTMELTTYASREGNHLPVIDFNGAPDTVELVEGEFFSATISATDADGDPVVLSRTPMENTTFDPARGIFTFRPDALQITEGGGHYESMYVDFVADDGIFKSTRRMNFQVDDVPGWATLDEIDTDGDGAGNLADPDDDNDGMPDTFENQYGLDPLAPDGAEHGDADGLSNWEEYIAGTDPTNGASCFEILSISGGGTIISWSSAAARRYTVESATNLAAASFLDVAGGNGLPATPEVNAFTNPPAVGPEPVFYRVKVRME
ncbi:Ig-like domain-containing protein [Pontiella sulfatireligans]|uniref:BIG2 domain-containing protein n=1 Tax=Pontiella sulfatireligans TaxID=2750658 RepID=A0A6C2USN8_9BACT|nr:hypothetical protein [Pontiella sulfatireligans]VGO22271.1 hypothetical protein SCARR_04353 [Pontiella sulfatireligans]